MAFLLSTLAIFTYYWIFPPQVPEAPEEQVQIETSSEEEKSEEVVKSVEGASIEAPVLSQDQLKERKTVKVESDLYSIEIDSLNGILKQFYLKNYKYATEPHFSITEFVFSLFSSKEKDVIPYDPERLVNMAGDISSENEIWRMSVGPNESATNFHVSKDEINIRGETEILTLQGILPNGLEEIKTITFYPDSYAIDLNVKIINRTGSQQSINPYLNFGVGGEAIEGESLPQPRLAVTFIDEDFDKHDGGDVENTLAVNNAVWAGLMDKYFLTAIKMADGSLFKGELTPVNSRLNSNDVLIPKLAYKDTPVSLGNGQEYNRSFKLYVGPKVESSLESFDYYLPQAMDLGWFEVLARPLLSILRWLQGYVVNWGVAIILLTIIVRTAMFPLAYKSMTSMRKMQVLGPKINALREKHKNNKEKMNQEIMKFYGQHKVNPMGGCLPLLLQFPIFIALYQALLPAIELRHTPFVLFWADLSAADYTLILPALMGISMYSQQKMTPTPTMDPTQAKIMKWMPVMMVLFFLNMPSGLVLYWVISNIITVGQQLVFNKIMPPTPVADDKKDKKDKKDVSKGKAGKGAVAKSKKKA